MWVWGHMYVCSGKRDRTWDGWDRGGGGAKLAANSRPKKEGIE